MHDMHKVISVLGNRSLQYRVVRSMDSREHLHLPVILPWGPHGLLLFVSCLQHAARADTCIAFTDADAG